MVRSREASAMLFHHASSVFSANSLFIYGFISTLGYFAWYWLSFGPLKRGNYDDGSITWFLVIYAVLFTSYALLIFPLLQDKSLSPRHLWLAIGFALLFRAIMLPSELMMEDDIYRYMWDGHMQTEGVNPFHYAPSHPETEPYRTEYWDKINYPYVPTIYPPTLQNIFLFANLLFPGSVLGMKFILVLFDVGTIFLLLALLKNLRLPIEWCLVYAWSPLVVKEIANSGHADSVSAFLLVFTLWLISKQKHSLAAITLAFMTLTKFFGVFLLPIFYQSWKWFHYAFVIVVMGLMYAPFVQSEINLFKGFVTFSNDWVFNAGIYDWLRDAYRTLGWYCEFDFIGHSVYWGASSLARYSLMGMILLVVLYQTIRMKYRHEFLDLSRAMLVILGTLLMLSPVIDPWYLTWIIPLLCLHPSWAWIAFTGLVYLSYTYYYDYQFPAWVQPVQFGLFFTFLFLEMIYPKWQLGQQAIDSNKQQTEESAHAN